MFQEWPSETISSVLIMTTACKKKERRLVPKGSKVRVCCYPICTTYEFADKKKLLRIKLIRISQNKKTHLIENN